MSYNDLKDLSCNEKTNLSNIFYNVLFNIKNISIKKILFIINDIPLICKLDYQSNQYSEIMKLNYNKVHPIVPLRGEIYNAFITQGVGKELCGRHPVLIIQNQKANIHASKVNILPIEGDGTKINPIYHEQIENKDLIDDKTLIKNPSRVIISEILTIDKSRLGIKIGKLTNEKMELINKKLFNQLQL